MITIYCYAATEKTFYFNLYIHIHSYRHACLSVCHTLWYLFPNCSPLSVLQKLLITLYRLPVSQKWKIIYFLRIYIVHLNRYCLFVFWLDMWKTCFLLSVSCSLLSIQTGRPLVWILCARSAVNLSGSDQKPEPGHAISRQCIFPLNLNDFVWFGLVLDTWHMEHIQPQNKQKHNCSVTIFIFLSWCSKSGRFYTLSWIWLSVLSCVD